jgi:anti-sigma factor RsiW
MDEDEMACKELVELVTEYLEGSLEVAEGIRLEAHLAECDGCSTYLEQMRTTIRLTGMLSEDRIPAEGRERLLRVYRSWRAERASS